MNAKYFNKFEFKKAISFFEINPYEAKKQLEEYLTKYPLDYNAYTYYISSLISIGEDKKAEELLKKIENELYFKIEDKKKEIMYRNIIFIKMKLLSYQEKYEELYELCILNFSLVRSLNLIPLYLICVQKLGKEIDWFLKNESYLLSQIKDYSDEKFIEHIKKHLADHNCNLDNPNDNIFCHDFPYLKIIEEIKKYIPSNKKQFRGFHDDTYVFKYDECGRVKTKLTNYFKVACFHNTVEFITMVPVISDGTFPYVDLNYLKDEKKEEQPKIKTLSQIDKFNKRYKR